MELQKETEVIGYVRVPIKFKIPDSSDMQARKNPFNKATHGSTLNNDKSQCSIAFKDTKLSNIHSHTFSATDSQSLPRPDSVLIPSHSLSLNDFAECITEDQCEWMSELGSESNIIEDVKKKKIDYTAVLSREVVYNFNIMSLSNFDTNADFKSKMIAVPGISKSKKILILDLDDTLTHTMNPSFNYSHINITDIKPKTLLYKNPESMFLNTIKILIRPNAIRLLEELSKYYQIIVICLPNNRFLQHLGNAMLIQY